MKRQQTNLTFPIVLLLGLILGNVLSAQEIPSNFEFKRETGQVSGAPIFSLRPSVEAMTYDMTLGSTFEALGLLVQPDRNKYGVLFFNAKKTYEFVNSRDKSCLLQIDGSKTNFSSFTHLGKGKAGMLRLETVMINLDKDVFWKLMAADDVVARCGKVFYNLDQDNIDAFRYFASEVKKDLERRKIKI